MKARISLGMAACIVVALLASACSDDEETPAQQAAAETPATGSTTEQFTAGESTVAESAAAEGGITVIDTRPSGGSGFDPIKAYDAQCTAEEEPSLECEWLRGLVVADVVQSLDAIQDSRDRRGVAEAVAALDIDDEPEVLIAACRVLGHFPDTPGSADKLTALVLQSPFLEVRRMAANVLERSPDPGLAAMAGQWLQNHSLLQTDDVYDELPGVSTHYAGMGFPAYPGAERYSPADSDRSVGWSSADTPSVVAERLGKMLGVTPIDSNDWIQRTQQQMMNAYDAMDRGKMDEVQQLTEEYVKTQDPALIARIETLQQEINAPMKQFSQDAEKTLDKVVTPADFSQPENIYYFVAEEKAGHVARLVLVYPQSGLGRTVIQTAWDLRDYPAAWPIPGAEPEASEEAGDAAARAAQSPAASITAPAASANVPTATQVALAEIDEQDIVQDPKGQWASAARASTQYGDEDFSARQATGTPDVPSHADDRRAWAPSASERQREWLEVTFATPVSATELRIRQSFNPGTIVRVDVIDTEGRSVATWSGRDASAYLPERIAWFAIRFPATQVPVQRARIVLDTPAAKGWKEIDAVQLVAE
jgi:hypothetical protein